MTDRTSPTGTEAGDSRPSLGVGLEPLSERRSAGRALRSDVPRSSHGHWRPAPDRTDPIAQIEASDRTRIGELVPIRVQRMAASPFGYYRGAADMMARDLASSPVTGIEAQLCGDAHCMNFGFYGSPSGRVVADVNDFDETALGPWAWDVKRLAASLVLAGRHNRVSDKRCAAGVRSATRAYRQAVARFSAIRVLDLWHTTIHAGTTIADTSRPDPHLRRLFTKARRKNNVSGLPRLTDLVEGRRRFLDRPPLLAPIDNGERDEVLGSLAGYAGTIAVDHRRLLVDYRVVDVARKVVGVGSVGAHDYAVLLLGNGDDDPLFLQVKEAVPSGVRLVLGSPPPVHEGKRCVEGQRLIQTVSDGLLGWADVGSTPCYVRQLRDLKASIPIRQLRGRTLADYGAMCGFLLAKAHARTGDPARIAGYCGRRAGDNAFDHAIAAFARTYADQAEQDHAELVRAVREGRVESWNGRARPRNKAGRRAVRALRTW